MTKWRKVITWGRYQLRVSVYEKAHVWTLLARWVVTEREYNDK